MKAGWEAQPLAALCKVFADGDWIETKDQSESGIRLIQTGNVGAGVFKDRAEKARYISAATFDRLRCNEIFEGDCLISRLPDPVGRSCIIPMIGERMITAVDCTIMRFNPAQMIPSFFNYYSQSKPYLSNVDKETTGTTRKRISRSKLGEILIPVPPLTEQRRTVSILDEAFAGLEAMRANTEKNLQNAQELFESFLNAVFAERDELWSECALGELATFRNGINYTKASRGESIKVVGVADFQNDFWASLGELQSATVSGSLAETDLLNEGDILFVRSNGNVELIGRTLLIGSVSERVTHSGFTIRARLNSTKAINPQFICWFLKSGNARRAMVSGGIGTNIKSLNQTTLSRLTIPLPPRSQQEFIVARINDIRSESQRLTSLYEQKLAAIDELKQSILQKAFAGELTAVAAVAA
ncbi:MAG: hypothetical protein FJX40_02870 [Alphaproteobacteria bacterium]|nr:hypothetical protein [Alphaproteobacteria bacterium]MBM3640825.1 hypothetical protein [Alphaproteobacteria bacterium]